MSSVACVIKRKFTTLKNDVNLPTSGAWTDPGGRLHTLRPAPACLPIIMDYPHGFPFVDSIFCFPPIENCVNTCNCWCSWNCRTSPISAVLRETSTFSQLRLQHHHFSDLTCQTNRWYDGIWPYGTMNWQISWRLTTNATNSHFNGRAQERFAAARASALGRIVKLDILFQTTSLGCWCLTTRVADWRIHCGSNSIFPIERQEGLCWLLWTGQQALVRQLEARSILYYFFDIAKARLL